MKKCNVRGKNGAAYGSVMLCGNPNVGKSTLFNALTGLKQHTGNWTGKTVESARGRYCRDGRVYELCDLPGCYSLEADSPEEAVTRDCILSGEADCTVIVCDATCLERGLFLALQVLRCTRSAVLCLNFVNEALRQGKRIDAAGLSKRLGIETVCLSRMTKRELDELCAAVGRAVDESKNLRAGDICGDNLLYGERFEDAEPTWAEAASLAKEFCQTDADSVSAKRLKLDRLLTGRITGRLAVLLLLGLVLYLTMAGANYPSTLLGRLLGQLLEVIRTGLVSLGLGASFVSAVCDGMLLTLFTVVSVMLPPMAIFFPLFTLLEDFGFLPRMAFDLDCRFCRCGSCGKQMLTMCMGLGCNAVGVTGCRIIAERRSRIASILTNSLMPCNGRFPAIAALITVFALFIGIDDRTGLFSAGMLLMMLVLAFSMTLGMTRVLTRLMPGGGSGAFLLELPPYRRPRFMQVIVRSVFDRTLKVLGRAVIVSAPAGLLIWLLGRTGILTQCVAYLDPIGRAVGLDGAILMAFILGLPANELILPLTLMIYSGGGTLAAAPALTALAGLTAEHGWTPVTALCMMLLMLFHSPCATTLLTIRRETRSVWLTLLAVLLPTAAGLILCIVIKGVSML